MRKRHILRISPFRGDSETQPPNTADAPRTPRHEGFQTSRCKRVFSSSGKAYVLWTLLPTSDSGDSSQFCGLTGKQAVCSIETRSCTMGEAACKQENCQLAIFGYTSYRVSIQSLASCGTRPFRSRMIDAIGYDTPLSHNYGAQEPRLRICRLVQMTSCEMQATLYLHFVCNMPQPKHQKIRDTHTVFPRCECINLLRDGTV